MRRIYLDNASTTPILPEVLEEMLPFFSSAYGNPSSIHALGRAAKEAIENSRDRIARLLGCQSCEVIFVSGGTEADNLAIKGVAHALRRRGKHMITSVVEHHAVLNAFKALESEGFHVTYVPVDSKGMVDPGSIEDSITRETILVSVMHANNEVGTIEPIEEIGSICQEHEVVFHTDAVQSFGHIPTFVDKLGVDLLSTSAHKLYGPKGVGALYVRQGTEIEPIIHGGGQERGLRSSTENVPGIVGFGKAAELALRQMAEREAAVRKLRDRLCRGILDGIDQSFLNGNEKFRLPGNLNVTLRYVDGESVILGLDELGICGSTGSACGATNRHPSHVLEAMKLAPEDLHSTVRLSLGIQNTEAEIDFTIEAMIEVVERLRKMSPLYAPSPRTPWRP